MAARGRRGTFAFDLSHPAKKGVLLKQGAFHKAFKYRFFLVYPGFLVYYEQESKWLLDLTKGETLGGRLGAIKLKNGSCNVARNAPKACKFGFIVHAPDPVNKRQTYLINATSKQERDEWIEAIRKSTPVSPQQKRKNESSPKHVKEEPKKSEKEAIPSHPVSPVRQDTAAEAAAAVTENERLNGLDQSVTSSIDESLQPTMDIRRDTATTAALSLSVRAMKEDSSISGEAKDTSIDDVLGPQADEEKESDNSDEDCQNTTSSASSSVQSPEPGVEREPDVEQEQNVEQEPDVEHDQKPVEQNVEQEQNVEREPDVEQEQNVERESDVQQEQDVEQESDTGPESTLVDGEAEEAEPPKVEEEEERAVATENTATEEASGERGDSAADSSLVQSNKPVERQPSQEGLPEVVTTVTIECSGEVNPPISSSLDRSKEATPTEGGEGEREERANSQEAAEGEEGGGLEVSTSEVHLSQERSNSFSVTVNNIDTDDYSSSEDEGTQLPPPPPPADDTQEANGTSASQEVTSSEDTPKENDEFPIIKVVIPEGGDSCEPAENGSTGSGEECEKLSALAEKRRPSQVFIDKKGFLYKMGGKRKNWNLRYFILQPGVFTYAKNPSSKVLGEVKLKNLQVFFPGIGERKTSFQFTIHTESTWNKRMDWVLAAQSEREMKDWITAFKLAGQKNTPSPSPAISDNELESSS